MTINIYSLYDKKTLVYGRPFFAHNDGHALRLVTDELSDPQSQIGKHPSDYSCHRHGEYNDSTGVITTCEISKVIDVDQLLEKEQK